MKINNPEAKTDLARRLQRIEGQVRGIRGMLEDERECSEIVQQLAAVHSAVQSASRSFLQEYASACLLQMDEENPSRDAAVRRQEREKVIRDMIALLDKAP